MNMPPIDVSIILPCRNEVNYVPKLLNSLLNQHFGQLRWEAIIADGLSTDGTRELLDAVCHSHPQIRLLDNPGRIVSTGLNAAIRQASGAYILRMDFHTEYAPDYVARCIDTIQRTKADNVGGPARTRAVGLVSRAIAAAYHSRFACGGAKFHDEHYEGYTDTVPYGCMHKSTLERIGLFDETLVRNQDDELNLRLIRAGGKIWQSPEIVSWYSPRSTLAALWRQYFQYGFWKIPVIRKHRLPASWRHLVPVSFVAANMLLLLGTGVELARQLTLSWFLWSWVLLVVFYGSCCAAAALITARQHGWRLFFVLPLVFATYHFSYGLGFFGGLLYWYRKSSTTPASTVLTGLSR